MSMTLYGSVAIVHRYEVLFEKLFFGFCTARVDLFLLHVTSKTGGVILQGRI